MNIIEIRGLEVSACHGVLDFEKTNPQKFVFDVDLKVDFFPVLASDSITSTVNYAEVCALIERVTKRNKFNLIEKLALECAFSVFEKFSAVQGVKLTCRKPEAPVEQKFESVAATVELERVKAYLSLGSSMGNKEKILQKSVRLLNETRGVKVEKLSPFWENEPYGGVAKNKFLNGAACVSTFLPPHVLLDEIHRIENALGRVREKKWDDRTLDIDIIFYGDKTICDERLTVPHPDWINRDFVKIPLKNIAPHLFSKLT